MSWIVSYIVDMKDHLVSKYDKNYFKMYKDIHPLFTVR